MVIVAVMLLLIVGGVLWQRRSTVPAPSASSRSSSPAPMEQPRSLQQILSARQWTIKLPQSEELDGRTTVFLANRYFLLSPTGEVVDQGNLEINEAQHRFVLRNTDGSLTFQDLKETDQGFTARVNIATTFFHTELEPALVFVPAEQVASLPSPRTIHEAAIYGDAAAIDRFLATGVSIDVVDEGGVTPLMYASYHVHPETVEHLLAKGANPALLSKNGKNALLLAAETGNIGAIRALVAKGVSVNSKTTTGRTPLHLVMDDNALDLATALIELRADVNAKDGEENTPLHDAIASLPGETPFEYKDNLPMVRLLVEHGAGVNAKNTSSETPLGKAIGLGLFETVQYLLSKGADSHITIQGQPLHEFLNGQFATPEFRDKILPLLSK